MVIALFNIDHLSWNRINTEIRWQGIKLNHLTNYNNPKSPEYIYIYILYICKLTMIMQQGLSQDFITPTSPSSSQRSETLSTPISTGMQPITLPPPPPPPSSPLPIQCLVARGTVSDWPTPLPSIVRTQKDLGSSSGGAFHGQLIASGQQKMGRALSVHVPFHFPPDLYH